MPNIKEQQRTIAVLRENCRIQEEALYRARLELHRTLQQVKRAEQKQTVGDPERDRQIDGLRTRIAVVDARLAALREESRQVTQALAQSAELQRLVQHLQQNLTSVKNRMLVLQRQIGDLRQQNPPPVEEIETIETERGKLESIQADLEKSLRQTEETAHQMQEENRSRRRRQEALQADIETQREEIRAAQEHLTSLLQPAFQDTAPLRARQKELEAAVKDLAEGYAECDRHLQAAIGDMYRETPHPKDGLSQMDDRTPFLLFPVRIETIFVPAQSQIAASQSELWVRVYPDEIAVQTHEKTLTDREVEAGELYWTELVTAEHLRGERDRRRRAAWHYLVELLGGQRAAWVAQKTKPLNWDALAAAGAAESLPDFLRAMDASFFSQLLALDLSDATRTALQKAISDNDGDAFSRLADAEHWFDRINTTIRARLDGFPAQDLTKTDAWTRAPRTQLMPDRFVLLLYGNETAAPREVVGSLIPDSLYLGPDPLAAKDAFTYKENNPQNPLTYGGSFDWMSDFNKAVQQGMGFRVRLTEEEARIGFAKLIVLGVMLSSDAASGAVMVEEMIDNHQFSPKGFSLVPQGTPTNNTEHDRSGYSENDAYNDLAFFTDLNPPAFDAADPNPQKSQTDGRLLADALGISYAPMLTVQHADQTDALEATLLNRALFPGTLGYWLKTWMAPVISEETARQTRSFFTKFVTGRGPLPAVRVGNQPYGVLLTSDFSRWKYPDANQRIQIAPHDQTPFLKALYTLLAALEKEWDSLAASLPYVGKPGSDASKTLMDILGLNPTAVEFYQRVGYSAEYLRNLDAFKNRGKFANELASLLLSMPATARLYLRNHGFEETIGNVGAMKSLHVLWQHYVTALDSPNLVENIPPSETKPLTLNYIDWLARAETTEKIINQSFGVPPPSALLYLLLRNALLLQLHHGSYEWLSGRADFDPALQQSTLATTLPGMRPAAPTLSKFEMMAVKVDVAGLSPSSPGISVADWIWNGPPPEEVEAAFLREQKAALSILAQTPTARLERCLVEHIDLLNYRLDAWQTALFAQRLQAQRASGGQPNNRQMGVYIGAFGWVEHVVPSRKVFLNPDSVPASLRPNDSHPVLEEDDVLTSAENRQVGSRQGGFVHTPSLNHASAAALLRNAYLSHASPEQAELFSVNLSSERVRRAQFILEGMRNGQPMEALLGYQFERRLHDLTSASAARGDVPVLEFNQFILPYRQAFPFEAREIVQSGTGEAVEAIPAYSVVNGLRLIQADLSDTNGYGLEKVLPAGQRPDPARGAAIVAVQNGLRDTLDAVKDLLMAENAYQLVRGNFDRVSAVSLAQKEANIPPELEVINTPRGTEFTFTNRVTLHFADLDPSLPSSNPWPAIPLTPRAQAETGMNHWLGHVLGQHPEKIRCDVYWVAKPEDGPEAAQDRHPVTLADLGLQPIDFVWLVGAGPEKTGGATELETRVASSYRRVHSIADSNITRIEFHPPLPAGEFSFAQFFPLARHLRTLLSKSRALHAQDFLPAAGGKETAPLVDAGNPKGYDVAELRSRVQSSIQALTALADQLDGLPAPSVELVLINDPKDPVDDETFVGTLGAAFTRLEDAKLTFTDSQKVHVNFLLADAETLRLTLQAVAAFGIPDAYTPETDLSSTAAKAVLLARAQRTARRLRRSTPAGSPPGDGVLDRVNEFFTQAAAAKGIEQQVNLLLAAGKSLFGDTFDWLPKFRYTNEIDLSTADMDRAQLLSYAVGAVPGLTAAEVVEEWLQGLARVRRPIHTWEVVRTLADALNDVPLEMRPIQVPYRANDCWLAVEFPEKDPGDPSKPFGISRDTLSITAHGATAFQPGLRHCGLLLDDWTEEIPTAHEITGISFRFNQPNAAPPQTLLLVVTPEESGSWKWEDLVGTLTDTLRRAKRRAVEPDQLEKLGSVWNAFAPALVSEFSTRDESDVSLDLIGMIEFSQVQDFYTALSKKP